MPQAKSWMTSDDIIASVKRRISFPVSQNTFTEQDILAFANEELLTSQLPSVLQYHEEFYVYKVIVPLQNNLSRYSIPDRAIGMRLRDVKWTDAEGNYFDMTRISDNDKGFFQRSIGANQAISKFYVEGNDIVLTPSVVSGPTGNLNFFIFIRPNQLVDTTRAAYIKNFNQTITLSGVHGGDSLYINGQSYTAVVPTWNVHTYSNANITVGDVYQDSLGGALYTALNTVVNSNVHALFSGSTVSTPTSGELIKISGSGDSNVFYTNPFVLQIQPNQFPLGPTDTSTATYLATYLNTLAGYQKSIPNLISATASSNTILLRFSDQNYSFEFNNKAFDASAQVNNISPNTINIPSHGLSNNTQVVFFAPLGDTLPTGIIPDVKYYIINSTANTFQLSTTLAGPVLPITGTGSGICYINSELSSPSFQIPLSTSGIEFTSLPSTYLDPVTNITEPLFVNNSLVDFLQTNPGHRIENYNVLIPPNSISGNIITFNSIDIPVTAVVGDYICLANECIIPYLPPDLHNVLAERTAARILSAMGDQQGLQNSMQKLAEMEKSTGELVDNRVENTPKKINARHSILHFQKSSYRRRF